MRKHIALTALGLVIGLAFLAWLRPNEASGATVVLVLCVILANAAGAMSFKRAAKPPVRRRRSKVK
jgi:multisubunit Na+/H+ antiporter MnhG subunit